MLNTCVHHKAKAIYDNWYADIRILGRLYRLWMYARHQTINCDAHVYLYEWRGLVGHSDRYVHEIYGRINIHIVKY